MRKWHFISIGIATVLLIAIVGINRIMQAAVVVPPLNTCMTYASNGDTCPADWTSRDVSAPPMVNFLQCTAKFGTPCGPRGINYKECDSFGTCMPKCDPAFPQCSDIMKTVRPGDRCDQSQPCCSAGLVTPMTPTCEFRTCVYEGGIGRCPERCVLPDKLQQESVNGEDVFFCCSDADMAKFKVCPASGVPTGVKKYSGQGGSCDVPFCRVAGMCHAYDMTTCARCELTGSTNPEDKWTPEEEAACEGFTGDLYCLDTAGIGGTCDKYGSGTGAGAGPGAGAGAGAGAGPGGPGAGAGAGAGAGPGASGTDSGDGGTDTLFGSRSSGGLSSASSASSCIKYEDMLEACVVPYYACLYPCAPGVNSCSLACINQQNDCMDALPPICPGFECKPDSEVQSCKTGCEDSYNSCNLSCMGTTDPEANRLCVSACLYGYLTCDLRCGESCGPTSRSSGSPGSQNSSARPSSQSASSRRSSVSSRSVSSQSVGSCDCPVPDPLCSDCRKTSDGACKKRCTPWSVVCSNNVCQPPVPGPLQEIACSPNECLASSAKSTSSKKSSAGSSHSGICLPGDVCISAWTCLEGGGQLKDPGYCGPAGQSTDLFCCRKGSASSKKSSSNGSLASSAHSSITSQTSSRSGGSSTVSTSKQSSAASSAKSSNGSEGSKSSQGSSTSKGSNSSQTSSTPGGSSTSSRSQGSEGSRSSDDFCSRYPWICTSSNSSRRSAGSQGSNGSQNSNGSQASNGSNGSQGSSQNSSLTTACLGNECGNGGSLFCAAQNKSCVNIPNLPCITCVGASSTSSAISCIGTCGNNLRECSEECDDGNLKNDDGCSNVCFPENGYCGDRIIQSRLGEECEPDLEDTGVCSASCQFANRDSSRGTNHYCGDGRRTGIEECDDGNSNERDSCDNFCNLTSGSCGDGVIQVNNNEECEPSRNIGIACGSNCRYLFDQPAPPLLPMPPRESSSYSAFSESLTYASATGRQFYAPGDAPIAFPSSLPACTKDTDCPYPGLCILNRCLSPEQLAMLPVFCGNARIDPGEGCDNGALNGNAQNTQCRSDCTPQRCGDGIVDTPIEQCDDGNTVRSDGCSPTCQPERTAADDTQTLPATVVELPFAENVGSSAVIRLPNGEFVDQNGNRVTDNGQPVITKSSSAPTTPDTGPAAIIIMIGGAAAGWAFRRKK